MEARLFNQSKPEDKFYILLSDTIVRIGRSTNLAQGHWKLEKNDEVDDEMDEEYSCGRSFFACLCKTTLLCMQVAAVIACIVMSSLRLRSHDFVDPINQHSDDHKNIRMSLFIFYVLALSQGILFFLTPIVANPVARKMDVCWKYGLHYSWSRRVLSLYVEQCFLKCMNGDVRKAADMDLVTFAKQLSNSDSIDEQLQGFGLLDYLLRKEEYKADVLKRIRASSGTVQKAVHMLGLKTQVVQDTKGHAARILQELAGDLQVRTFPEILQSISSLLSSNKIRASGSSSASLRSEKDFTLIGVTILKKLFTDPDNCAQILEGADNLLFQIIDLTSCSGDSLDSDIDKIVEISLEVLQRLVSTAGKTGYDIRYQVSRNVHIIANIRKILIAYAGSHPELLIPAVHILACLALDDTTRKGIRNKRPIIRKLISLISEEMDAAQDHCIREVAAEALVVIISKDGAQAILAETTPEDMEKIVMVLSDTSAWHRAMVAKLLQNLRTYQGAEYRDQLKRIDQAQPIVLAEATKFADELETGSSDGVAASGKLLESFIGLSVQICAGSGGKEFSNALASLNLTDNMFALHLKKILDAYESPTEDYPGIRRVVIQQLNWMMEDRRYLIYVLLNHGMDKTLKKVVDTASKLEDFWFFRSGVAAFEHAETISSLVSSSPIMKASGST